MSTTNPTEQSIFLAALELGSAQERVAYLQENCGDDGPLREAVESLLDAHEREGNVLDSPAFSILSAPESQLSQAGDSDGSAAAIGPYKLLELIGEGGFGVVYMAEQTAPVRRKVALKILKPGMDTRQVVARFEAERQALAIMDHPNIAKVFDGGTTGEPGCVGAGRPYFVMELVKGIPITEFCDQNHLTPRQRLELFIPVCHAVQHAHQKGIIHRDLKPSNVLVSRHDSTPVPKVIDFGVAKALGQELTEKTLFTGIAQMIGTPLYMSPEQAGMSDLDVDTRSDIYSLGVLLYELLTGTTPFDKERLKLAAFDEIRRIIRDEEPPKPSTRLSASTETLVTISAQRHTEPARLTKLVRGELDWIVMKALEKDRNRRYETANELALEVQRYLKDQPVHACPPSAAYRFRKFSRRNKALLAVIAGSVVAILLLAGGFVVHHVRIAHERDEKQSALEVADAQQRRAQANLQHSLDAISGMLDLAERHLASLPQAEGVRENFLQSALESCQRIADTESGDPAARRLTARAYNLVGRIKSELGRPVEAEQALRKALDLSAKLADDHPNNLQYQGERAASQFWLGVNLRSRGHAQEAESLLRQSVILWKQLLADPASVPGQQQQLPNALRELGYLHWSVEQHRQAEVCYQEALQLLRSLQTAFPEEAENSRWLQESLHNSLGVLLRTTGRLPEAEQAFRHALQCGIAEEARSRSHLGIVLWMMGRMEEAERHQRDAVRIRELEVIQYPRGIGARSELELTYRWLGLLLSSTGKTQEAEQTFQKAIKIEEALVKEFPRETKFQDHLAGTQRYLGNLLRDTARWSEAESAYRAALSFQEEQAKKNAADEDDLAVLAITCKDFGNLLAATGKAQDAKPYFDKARQGFQQALQLRVERRVERYTLHDYSARFLATCPDLEFRDPSSALASAKKAVELAPQVGSCWTTLGIVYYRIGRWQEAVDALQKSCELRAGGDATEWYFLAMARWQLGDKDQARTWYDRAVQWMEKHQPKSVELTRFRAEAAELLKN